MVELVDVLKDDFKILADRQSSHLHLKAPIAGVSLTDEWLQLGLDTTNYAVKMLGGWSFDDANDRIYWDQSGDIGIALPLIFIGDAGVQVTSGITGSVTVSMGLFVDGELILETPITFTIQDSIQGYGANGILLDALDDNLIQPGSYYEFWARAGAGQTPTITLAYLNTTVERL